MKAAQVAYKNYVKETENVKKETEQAKFRKCFMAVVAKAESKKTEYVKLWGSKLPAVMKGIVFVAYSLQSWYEFQMQSKSRKSTPESQGGLLNSPKFNSSEDRLEPGGDVGCGVWL